jgi:UDP-N-acetylmuramoyl-L-alanyl-D-glutamate--2,6-diaminopimelate ligase
VPVLVVPEPRACAGRGRGPDLRPRQRGADHAGDHRDQRQDDDGLPARLGAARARAVTGLIGTVETRIGEDRIKSIRTTPESSDLHALFAVMLEKGVDTCTMEVSSHAWPCIASTVCASTSPPSPTCRRITSTSTGRWRTTSWQRRRCSPPSERFAPWSAWTTNGASAWPGVRGARGDGLVPPGGRGRLADPDHGAGRVCLRARRRRSAHVAAIGPARGLQPGQHGRGSPRALAAGHPAEAIEAALAADPHVPGRMERIVRQAANGGDQSEAARAACRWLFVDFAHTPTPWRSPDGLAAQTPGSLIVGARRRGRPGSRQTGGDGRGGGGPRGPRDRHR